MKIRKISQFSLLSSLLLASILFILTVPSQVKEKSAVTNPDYDANLAAKWKSDDHGMRKYVIAFLKKGPNRNQNEADAKALQKAHMENIKRLADEGKLVVAGPFLDGGELQGIYIFAVDTVEEAQKLTETDPAVKAGRLTMELHPWYGSASLLEINTLHYKAVKQKTF